MSAGDFLQVLLGGLSGGMGAAANEMTYQQHRKEKNEDAKALAKIVHGGPLDSIIGSMLGSAVKQGVKSGRTYDFGSLMADDGKSVVSPELMKLMGVVLGGGGGGAARKTRRLSSNGGGASSGGVDLGSFTSGGASSGGKVIDLGAL